MMMAAWWGYACDPLMVAESEYPYHRQILLDGRMLVLWGVCQRSRQNHGGDGVCTDSSATAGACCLWKAGGGCWYESTIGVSGCTDIFSPVGSIKEGILSGVCIVSSTDHAMRQTVYVLEEKGIHMSHNVW